MLLYRIFLWTRFPSENALIVFAQVETVWEQANKTAETFGKGDDHFRLGFIIIAFVAVLLVGNYIAFKLFIGVQNSRIKELADRAVRLEAELTKEREEHEDKCEEIRVHYSKLTEGYWGILNRNNLEFSTLNRVLESRELIMRRPPEPEIVPPPTIQAHSSKASFLPAGPRRIPRKPHLGRSGAREDQQQENE